MSAAAAQVAEMPATQSKPGIKAGEAIIRGRLVLVRRPTGNSTVWENLVVMPAPDPYSSPATVSILAKGRLGEIEDDVQVRVRIGGYRRSFKSTDRETGEIRQIQTADVRLFAIEE
ncbi:hypothetical protein [Thauera sp. Sel9]|uniref:hypothetical protein n=1 Tax=Thauera sp. Sel9 TaxID=2974299 RepID=UPI0021E19DD8|nr:hypothetical protein [Thauera sp. Sel9]MCV2216225.1 hypothetical protein [Thauera sp. Sel9]